MAAPTQRYVDAEENILKAATELFLANGYDISMDEVAARAGFSKATLYNHHASKRDLLEAVVDRFGERFMQRAAFGPDDGLDVILRRFAEEYERQSLSLPGQQFYRLFIADVSRFSDLAGNVYAATGGRAVIALAGELQRLLDQDAIRPVDPTRTAERFFGALTGAARYRACTAVPQTEAERSAHAEETVEMFSAWLKLG